MKKPSSIPLDELARTAIRRSIDVKAQLTEIVPDIARAAELLQRAYENGNKALFFGNGGSAADAQHFAAELVGRFHGDRRPLPALALNANTSSLTAIGNDYGYDQVFARQISAYATAGDVAVGISTSGTSRNVVAAAQACRSLGVKLIVLTGQYIDTLEPLADVVIAVPSTETPRIQEAHILIGHILCEWVELSLFGET